MYLYSLVFIVVGTLSTLFCIMYVVEWAEVF